MTKTSCLQRCTALGSTEAEYLGVSGSKLKIVWLQSVLNETDSEQHCITVHHDNTGSNEWEKRSSKTDVYMKNLDIRQN